MKTVNNELKKRNLIKSSFKNLAKNYFQYIIQKI